RNVADLLAEFAVLTGVTDAADERFQAFVARTIQADIQQAIGRRWAHRRPEESLQVILLSDFALDCPTQQVQAATITLEAASREERLLLAAKAAVEQLRVQGEKVTQTAIATMIGYSQQRVSQIWKLLLLLLESSDSKSSKPASVPLSASEAEVIAGVKQVVSTLVADYEAVPLLESISEVFLVWLAPRQRLMLWQGLSLEEQIRVLASLLLTLPSEILVGLR
nr:hypothetical protein [Stenomitos rutilans HA7619-LM2]